MKCPRCFALNCPTDDFCISCRAPLAGMPQVDLADKVDSFTPQWGYFFVALCGAIPVATVSAIPALLGGGSACACFFISRAYTVPNWLRFTVCLGITVVAWLLLITVVVELLPSARKRWMDLIR